MLGEKRITLIAKDWLGKLKSALVLEDFNKLESHLKLEPQFSTISELEEAKYLLKEAFVLSMQNREKVKILMEKVKRNIDITKASITKPHYYKLNRRF